MIVCAIQFRPDGSGICLATDTIELGQIGSLEVNRASNVEFNHALQVWEVRTCEKPDKIAFSNPSRKKCIDWEIAFFNKKILGGKWPVKK